MNKIIPKDTVLLISGVQCVGKTTTAYNIVQNYPDFRRVSELDIIRTIVRATLINLLDEGFINKQEIMDKYSELFKSVSESDYETAKNQSRQLVPYIKEIVLRQQSRRIPTIIEGSSIIPSIFFSDSKPLNWVNSNILFVNLYLSSGDEHITRRQMRCNEREYSRSMEEIKHNVRQIRYQKNIMLHNETLMLSKCCPNVFSIDVASKSPGEIVQIIMKLVYKYYDL